MKIEDMIAEVKFSWYFNYNFSQYFYKKSMGLR